MFTTAHLTTRKSYNAGMSADGQTPQSVFKAAGLEGFMQSISGMELVARLGVLNAVLQALYWDEKDVTSVVEIVRAADSLVHDNQDSSVLTAYKPICYNAASFLWRGWDEAGVTLSADDEALGLDYARRNLELAYALDRGDLAIGRAEWMLAGQLWASGDQTSAEEAYTRAELASTAAGEPLEALSARAMDQAMRRDPKLEASLAELDSSDDGKFFARQVRTAALALG